MVGKRTWAVAILLAMVFSLAHIQIVLAHGTGKTFNIVFSTNEDYDTSAYGTKSGLAEVEKDFQLVKELGLDKLRVSFSWSNYQPARDRFDNLEWLHQFVNLATEYEIELMPYLCYGPEWATAYGDWHNPPGDINDWYNYVYHMVSEFKDTINVWELWNEQDSIMWFSGDIDEYAEVLRVGAEAVKAANPDATVLMGGITWPNDKYVEYFLDQGLSSSFDVMPVHSYHESWNSAAVESYLTSWGSPFGAIADVLNTKGNGQPIWLNEIGYPTIAERTELDQARFIRRSIATLLATGEISLISWYEIKDLPTDFHLGVIGDDINYHLGLTHTDRTKKLGFYTYQNIVSLLNYEELTYLGNNISIEVEQVGRNPARVYVHGFQRTSDDHLILFAWLYGPQDVAEATITLPANIIQVTEYDYDGNARQFTDFMNNTMTLQLEQDHALLFEIQISN